MIAIDTSVILAIALREPEADPFERLVRRDAILIGWPTLLELRMVLTGKGIRECCSYCRSTHRFAERDDYCLR